VRVIGAVGILTRHAWVVWRAGQLRFRLETFGLYHPAPPYSRPWWSPGVRNVLLFARQSVAYSRWILEMERIRSGGPEAWWRRRERDGAGRPRSP
jgi:hypothetical protein